MNCRVLCTMLALSVGSRRFARPAGLWRRALRSSEAGLWDLLLSLRGLASLLEGDSAPIEQMDGDTPLQLFWQAFSLVLHGRFEQAEPLLQVLLTCCPAHFEGRLLLADCLALRDKMEAFDLLASHLHKKKTWTRLPGYVDTEEEWEILHALYLKAAGQKKLELRAPHVLESLSLAAQRAGLREEALRILEGMAARGETLPRKKVCPLAPGPALTALTALIRACNASGLELFLISGTLLGLVRGGTFLSSDTDIDTGIFAGFDPLLLRNAVFSAGCFVLLPQQTSSCLRVRHINGVPIDIFTHFMAGDDVWHGTSMVHWHNSPFGLKKSLFHGLPVLIPDKPEKYLEENYGPDWRTPRASFDSATDCPNGRVANTLEMQIYQLKLQLRRGGAPK